MKLEKAIEIKENHQRLHLYEYYSKLLDADNLSIEALKAVIRARHPYFKIPSFPLPGETKE